MDEKQAERNRRKGLFEIAQEICEVRRKPREYHKGDKVRRDLDGQVYTVKRSYWQHYDAEYIGSGDYTVELESIDPSQPTPWDKSRNLAPA